MGDPAGISPELTARLLALDEIVAESRIVVIGAPRVLDDGARVAGVTLDLVSVSPDADLSKEQSAPVLIDLGHLDPASVALATATAEGGRFALTNYRQALTMARDGRADAVCFTPFNKNAMRLAHPVYDDEISFSADVVGLKGPASEFNVLEGLWNERVTSHIPLAEVQGIGSKAGTSKTMFSWVKSDHLQRRIRDGTSKGERFAFCRVNYLQIPDRHQFYETVQGASDACRPDITDSILDAPEIATSMANLASKVVKGRETRVPEGDEETAEFITDAYATVALAFRRAAGAYNSDPTMQQLGMAAVHLLTIATSFMTARQVNNTHEQARPN